MMEILKYAPDHKEEWNSILEQSKNGLFLFHRDYMDYHSDRFVDHSLLIQVKGKTVALFPANEQDSEIISHAGLTFGSLITTFKVKTVEVLEILKEINDYFKNQSFSSITYKAIPNIFHEYPADEDLYALFRLNANLSKREISSVIKISKKIPFSQTKLQAVVKCKNNRLIIEESADFKDYWTLLTNVLKKFDAKPVHSLEEINKLKKHFPENIKLYEVRKENNLLAGVVIYDYGRVVHTQYMANSLEGRNIGALDYLNYTLIEEIYKYKAFFSFGISTEKQGRELNTGLIQQKELMGGRGVTLDTYTILL